MSVKSKIETKLVQAIQPTELTVVDESHLHVGHAGARPEGETHFRIYIVSDQFKMKTRLDCHRLIHTILAEELSGPIHALAIHASAPGGGGEAPHKRDEDN